MSQEAAERFVDAGFSVLQEEDPSGLWLDIFDLDTLDVRTLDNCVLAQLYGNYDTGLRRLWPRIAASLGIPDEPVPDSPLMPITMAVIPWAGEHGFAFAQGQEYATGNELNAAWRAKITTAREQRS